MSRMHSLLAGVAVVGMAGPLSMAATSWSVPAGSSDTITYTNGQTQTGLFTPDSPTVSQDTFIFDPSNFSATGGGMISYALPATPSDASTADDIASAIITAKTGRSLSHISAGLAGDYSIFTAGTTDAMGTLTVTNTSTHEILTRTFDFGGPFTSGTGVFQDDVAIDLPSGWQSAQVELAANLSASALPGSTSFIQLKSAQFGVETMKAAAVPLPPGALAAIPAIAIAGFAVRRKRIA